MTTQPRAKKAPAKKALAKETPAEKPTRAKRCTDCPIAKEEGSHPAEALVEKILGEIETKIQQDQLKPTVGDYLRLLQYRDEIQGSEQPKEIKVTWVDRDTTTPKSAA
jgi:hypothetical protein